MLILYCRFVSIHMCKLFVRITGEKKRTVRLNKKNVTSEREKKTKQESVTHGYTENVCARQAFVECSCVHMFHFGILSTCTLHDAHTKETLFSTCSSELHRCCIQRLHPFSLKNFFEPIMVCAFFSPWFENSQNIYFVHSVCYSFRALQWS